MNPKPPTRDRAGRIVAAIVGILTIVLAGPLAGQQRPAFDTTVARVRVDVIVTDADGRFVEGLGAGDFELFEDGEPQEVLAVELVDTGGFLEGTASTASVNAADERPAAAATGVASAAMATRVGVAEAAAPDVTGAAVALVFVVDLPGMDWRNKARFARAWEQLLADTGDLSVPRAVYMIDQVGRLRELTPLTVDTERLREAAATVYAEPLTRNSQQEQLASGFDGDARAESVTELARTRATLELLTQFCKALAAHAGRAALVWITSEVQIAEAGPIEAATEPLWAPFMADSLVQRRMDELHRAANSANVSIYTLDPTPVYELHGIGFDVQNRTAGRAELLESPLVQFALSGLRDALKDASAETGGKSFIHWMDPAEAIRAIESDARRFYLLTYANPPPIGDGRYHEIRVEVEGRDVNVRERRGYTDYPTDELADRMLSGALNLPGTVGSVPLQARALRSWSPTGDPVLQVALRRPEGLATDTSEFELHGLAVRADGVVEGTLEQRIRDAPDAVPSPVYVQQWDIAPGSYDLNLVVRDATSGRLSATVVPVEVLPATSEWATSDAVLMVADAAGRPVPLIGDVLAEDETVAAYVEVVFGETPLVAGELFNAEGTESIARLPPVGLQRGVDGIFRGALRMTGIPAGDYNLQVMVRDAVANKHRAFRLPLRVRPQ